MRSVIWPLLVENLGLFEASVYLLVQVLECVERILLWCISVHFLEQWIIECRVMFTVFLMVHYWDVIQLLHMLLIFVKTVEILHRILFLHLLHSFWCKFACTSCIGEIRLKPILILLKNEHLSMVFDGSCLLFLEMTYLKGHIFVFRDLKGHMMMSKVGTSNLNLGRHIIFL